MVASVDVIMVKLDLQLPGLRLTTNNKKQKNTRNFTTKFGGS